jgi:hypothetical protein
VLSTGTSLPFATKLKPVLDKENNLTSKVKASLVLFLAYVLPWAVLPAPET